MAQYYTNQDRIDQMTLQIDNPNVIGSGYIQHPPQRPFAQQLQYQPPTIAQYSYPEEYARSQQQRPHQAQGQQERGRGRGQPQHYSQHSHAPQAPHAAPRQAGQYASSAYSPALPAAVNVATMPQHIPGPQVPLASQPVLQPTVQRPAHAHYPAVQYQQPAAAGSLPPRAVAQVITSQQVTDSLSGLSVHDRPVQPHRAQAPVSRPAQAQLQRAKAQQPAAAETDEGSKVSKSQAKRLRKKLREGWVQDDS